VAISSSKGESGWTCLIRQLGQRDPGEQSKTNRIGVIQIDPPLQTD
jgi:hypothetical protein